MTVKNKSLDKMAEQFSSIEELQAYSASQYNNILSLNSKINEQNKVIEKLLTENAQLSIERSVAKANSPKDDLGKFATSDEETACVIQLALLKTNAMQRELTMDETKRLEIFTKTLHLIRGKSPTEKDKEEGQAKTLTNEELQAALKNPQ